MKSDLTRDTFDARNHFSRVLQQQGRVTLDADNNEQASILLHYLQTLAKDLIGPYGAPAVDGGFQLKTDEQGVLTIGAGRYYVDGILVENDQDCAYASQPDYPLPVDDALLKEIKDSTGKTFWIYLDVWERLITSIENDVIREKALGGPDTCTRAKVVWQVKALPIENDGTRIDNAALKEKLAALQKQKKDLQKQLEKAVDAAAKADLQNKITAVDAEVARLKGAATDSGPANVQLSCSAPLGQLSETGGGLLAARVDPGHISESPCITAPDAKYRGLENQLYRVEVHNGGAAGAATFKWSRDNGSVATAWLGTAGNDLQVLNSRGFTAGNWVELSDDTTDLQGQAGILVKLAKVEGGALTIDPASLPYGATAAWSNQLVNPKLRRWDQIQTEDIVLSGGAVPITEKTETEPTWIDLEDGIQVQFSGGGEYRTGDYWLIPARVATGEIEWPVDSSNLPAVQSAKGVVHHYAPLGYITWDDGELQFNNCRCEFGAIGVCAGATT